MTRDIIGMVRRGQERRPARIGRRLFVTVRLREPDGGDGPPRALLVASQAAMAASASATFSSVSRSALSLPLTPFTSAISVAIWFQWPGVVVRRDACQNRAISVYAGPLR